MKKPTVDQVYEYMLTRGFDNKDQAEAFFDHHESGGWKVGKKSMVKWEAAVRTWIRNAQKWSKPNETNQRSNQTFADTIGGQADRAREKLKSAGSGVRRDNIRPLRGIG